MKLYAPAYYQNFSCIADRCTHSCCIGWEIDVDPDTLLLYQKLEGSYADAIRESIAYDPTPHFALCRHDRCPHLDDQGLCNIIKAYGQGALCEICREHPRFYHQTPHGAEAGLGLACEQACRVVLSSDDFDRMIEIGEVEGEADIRAFDATLPRARVFGILKDASLTYEHRLARICDAFGVCLHTLTESQWCELLCTLEYLDEQHRALFMLYSADAEVLPPSYPILARALAYFIYRHCSDAVSEADFAASLGLSLFLVQLLTSLIAAGQHAQDAARIISEEIEYSEDNTDALRTVFYEVIQ